MKEGGWREKSEFTKYCEALEGIPAISKSLAAQVFVDKLSGIFIAEYERNLEYHVLKHWRSDKLLPYMVGGDPNLLKYWLITKPMDL